MDELDLLNEQEPLELDSLIDPVDTAPIGNKASNMNLAAHLSYLTGGEEVVNQYRQMLGEFSTDGNSLTAQRLLDQSRDANVKLSREALTEMLVNPEIDDETKAKVAEDFLNSQSSRYNVRNMVSERALSEPIEENVEQEIVRLDVGAWINEVNEVKKADQALLNAEVAMSDPETLTAFMDIAQYLSPFMESTMIAKLTKDFREGLENGEDVSGIAADAILLTGSAKAEMMDALRQLPPEQRHAVKQQLAKMISNASSIVMSDDNDFARTEMLRTFIEEDYTDADKWVDNAVSVLDATILGGPLVRLFRQAKKVKPAGSAEGVWEDLGSGRKKETSSSVRQTNTVEGVFEDVTNRRIDSQKFIKSNVQPSTLANNIKDVNPQQAASIHAAVVADTTEEMADALYGTTRTEAVANDLAHEIGRADGIIEHKVGGMAEKSEQFFGASPELAAYMARRGATWASEVEKAAARAVTTNDFQNAKGLTLRHEMSTVSNTDVGANFSAVFGPQNGGYRTAQDGVELTLYALRDYGVTAKELTILRNTPEGYKDVKVHQLDSTQEGDYLIKVDYNWEMKPLDVTSPEQWSVKRNLFDRFAMSMGLHRTLGTVTRNLFDPASILDPRMVKSAFAAVDRSARLEQILLAKGEGFAQKFEALPKERRDGLYDYFKEANHKGLAFNPTDLRAKGFTEKEIEVASEWRKVWDELYWLENDDMAKTLSNRGFKFLYDRSGKNKLIARPIPSNQQGTISIGDDIYDPVTDTVNRVIASDIAKLYKNGGTVARLRTPVTVDGKTVSLISSPENQGSVYFRALSKYDQPLPYREGYFKVNYTAPHFIVQRVKDDKGNILYEKAVSVAGTKADALVEAKRMARTTGRTFDQKMEDADYYIRGDAKGEERTDLEFDVSHAGGRSAQRFRGERLEEANAPNNIGSNHTYVMSPAESLVHAARNISRRVPMREWLDAMKDRYVKQYGKYLPTDKYGRRDYPTSISQIVKKGRMTDKDVADARTAWAYIEEMESGYINSIDSGYKALLNGLADALGNAGTSKGEKAVRVLVESRGPTEFAKNVAFHAYLVGHPLRQALIQAHQMIVYFPMNPNYVANNMVKDTAAVMSAYATGNMKLASKLAGRTEAELKQFMDDLEGTGLIASVDKQNLVRSSLSAMADEMHKWGPTRMLHNVGTIARKMGFDAGETANMIAVFGVFRDKALKEGRVLTPAVLEDIAAQARNYSLGMNRAGDMPYNQSALAMAFQFMQVPHKMSTMMTTNRILSRKERMKLATYVIPMWTLPAGAMYSILDKTGTLPENQEARALVVEGVEAYLINTAIQKSTGSDTRLDLSALGPFDAYGLFEFVHTFITSPPGEMLANTPSGQLFFGNNPRITDAFRTMSAWVSGKEEFGDAKTFGDVMKASAGIFSGFDAGFKAAYILDHGKKLSYSGAEVTGLDGVAAFGQLFGFNTIEEVERAHLKNTSFKNKESLKKNVTEYYNVMKRALADEGISNKDRQFIQTVLRTGMSTLKKEYGQEAATMLYDMMERDIKNTDSNLYRRIMSTSGYRTNEEIRKDLDMIKDWESDKKAKLFEQLNNVDKVEE